MTSRIENLNEGQLTISRWSGSRQESRCVTIRVIDKTSGIEFVCISVSPEELGLAITGQGHIACEYSVNGLQSIGKKSENKTEIIPYSDKLQKKHDPEALAAMEIDGWKVRRDDLINHHCWTEKGIRCVFFRLVGKGLIE